MSTFIVTVYFFKYVIWSRTEPPSLSSIFVFYCKTSSDRCMFLKNYYKSILIYESILDSIWYNWFEKFTMDICITC